MSESVKVIINDTLRKLLEDAHMAGQHDAGVDPSYSNAQNYVDNLFCTTNEVRDDDE